MTDEAADPIMIDSVKPSASRLRSRAESKRDRLLYAAMRCISRLGFRKSTMEEIAAEAGVSRITVYREFGNREALVAAVIAHRMGRFNDAFAAEHAPFRDVASALETYLLDSAKTARENVITRELVRGPLDFAQPGTPMHAVSLEMWKPLLERARAAGQIRKATNINEAVEWILLMQFTLCRLVVESELSERGLRSLVRSFVVPAFRSSSPAVKVRLADPGTA
jgi:AcrR family transcriptional regulator